jgi:hypothetical protein
VLPRSQFPASRRATVAESPNMVLKGEYLMALALTRIDT